MGSLLLSDFLRLASTKRERPHHSPEVISAGVLFCLAVPAARLACDAPWMLGAAAPLLIVLRWMVR